jgi:hypothetical protein
VFDSIPYDNQSQIILWNDGVKMKLLWVCHGKMTMTLLAIFDPKRSSFRLVAVSYSTILFHHFLLVDYCVYGLANVRSGCQCVPSTHAQSSLRNTATRLFVFEFLKKAVFSCID